LEGYQEQAEKAFEHEQKLRELLARQATLNAALDLDKNDVQAVAERDELEENAVGLRVRSDAKNGQNTLSHY
jgi:hypothetical protein